MTREQGECFFITNFNEIRADFWIRFYFSLCFQCTMSFYNSIGFSANLSLKRVLLCFYETWCRSLSNFESNSISLIMIFSVLSFNYNLIAEDLDFLRENLYITIHPFTYYVYILTHTFVSTLPIFIFSLFTSFSFLLIYYNLLLISSILNSFNNMSFKVIIISILMILQFLFPHGFGLNILYSQLIPNIICGIIKLVVSYSTFCVFISVYRKM
ncbi:hypothetical protein NBO_26g0011 [Nosema bombycis CQ1]|uniref:Uncharacterized protein n=1 Tax=Nosema bombycis (strain CQ1 / CVCC 102059) TaxID=578461 RepID=R0KUJ8_NOSB1|nr:hypothetical protein NBO_26g0011 [Nosema bombycis CQ1]|eukprot:EOB14526.1 hypothetical protein NBO_26g0011 [Nosema bombycis CQ1]